jgi:RNA polymerase sigma factor (sigma-70 family)
MKQYNSENFNRYKKDVKSSQPEGKLWSEYTRDELVAKFMPLVEKLARKFSTSHQASGVMTMPDMIQEGHIGLIKAVDRIAWPTIFESEDPERRLKSFLAKRIKGAIRRAVDSNRGTMRIPEHKINEIRKSFDKDEKSVESFFNSIFTSIESLADKNIVFDIPDVKENLNNEEISKVLDFLISNFLEEKEQAVIRMSYGLNCDKKPASEIAKFLNIKGESSYVRVSQLKRQAIDKLKQKVNKSQVADYL